MKLIHNKYLGVPNIFINMTTASTKYDSLNSDGYQFPQYQQNGTPLTLTYRTISLMVHLII